MMEELALVIASTQNGAVARVRTQRLTACESCQLKSGCGQQAMVRLTSGNSALEWSVNNTLEAREGDVVVLQIPESSIIGASFLLYLVPLFTMVLVAAVASLAGVQSEGWLSALALFGLGAGIVVARQRALTKGEQPEYQPRMARFASRQCP